MSETKELLVEIVNRIPRRRVASFGQIADVIAEIRQKKLSGQVVGWMLSRMKEPEWIELPRWRVVNKQWYISSLKLGEKGIKQIHLLEKEWIPVENNKVDMDIFRVENVVLRTRLEDES